MQTLFIVAGVAIGVAVIVFMSALLAGLQANFIRRVLTAQAHIVAAAAGGGGAAAARRRRAARVEARDRAARRSQRLRSIDQWQEVRAQIAGDAGGRGGLAGGGRARRSRCAAMRAASITLTGIEPERYFRIVALADKIVAGQPRARPAATS